MVKFRAVNANRSKRTDRQMQCMTYSRGRHRAYRHRTAYDVPYRELLVKFFELQQQLSQLNKLVHHEQVQSRVQRSVIKGLQRELKSATRQTETQRALKEKSILREEEIRRELVRLIKVHCEESPSPESNNRQKRRRKKKQRAEQERTASEMEQGSLQDRCKRFSEQQRAAKVPHAQLSQKNEFARKQADVLADTPTNHLSLGEKEPSRKRSIDELLLKFKQNCSLRVKISVKPNEAGEDHPDQELRNVPPE